MARSKIKAGDTVLFTDLTDKDIKELENKCKEVVKYLTLAMKIFSGQHTIVIDNEGSEDIYVKINERQDESLMDLVPCFIYVDDTFLGKKTGLKKMMAWDLRTWKYIPERRYRDGSGDPPDVEEIILKKDRRSVGLTSISSKASRFRDWW